MALDPNTFGYHWNYQLVGKNDSKNGPLATLPEYYHLVTPPAGMEAGYVPIATRQAAQE